MTWLKSLVVYKPEYDAKAAEAASILDFTEKWESKKDADAKLYYINDGTQVWKFNFIKLFFEWYYQW